MVAEAAAALRRGGLVLLPTAVGYVIATRAGDEAAETRLRELTGLSRQRPLTRLLADRSALGETVPAGAAEKLVARWWPGPLTLIYRREGEEVAVRVPAPMAVRQVLLTAGLECVATSANVAGEPPAVVADQAMAGFGEALELVLDGGPVAPDVEPTVVRMTDDGRPEVLREGVIAADEVIAAAARTIVFVCTGNTCRSPMAEGLLRDALARRLAIAPEQLPHAGWQVLSAGTAAAPGAAVSPHSVAAMADRGIDISGHRARPLVPSLLESADVVYGLTPGHVATICGWMPEYGDKVRPLDPAGVPDPFGGSPAHYRRCADHIEGKIQGLLAEMKGG